MKKRNKTIIWIIVIAVVVVGGLYLLRMRQEQAAAQANQLPDITMEYTVRRSDIGDYLEVMGTVDAPERKVYGRISGEINAFFIEENDEITEGATLAIIDSTEYELKALQAQTAYDNAVGGAPKTVEEKKLSLDIALEDLENTVITSPVSGFIYSTTLKENDLISANTVICTIVEDDKMYVEASVDEVDLTKIKVGQKVQFLFESLGNLKLNGEISEISPIADTSGGIVVIPVEFSFDNSPKGTGVIPGLTCSANILLMSNTDVITVPVLAVSRDKDGSYVMVDNGKETVSEDGKTTTRGEKRYITIGETTDQLMEVVDGLEEGEVILIQPDVARATQLMRELNPSFLGGNTGTQQMRMTGGAPTGGQRPAGTSRP